MTEARTILIGIYSRFPAWNIPAASVAWLREQFPHHTFLHARSEDEALGMNEKTFNGRVRIHYGGATPRPNAAPNFTVTYNDGNRALEIRFKEPLAPFQPVVLELGEGITAIDGQPLKPWTLKFTTGQ